MTNTLRLYKYGLSEFLRTAINYRSINGRIYLHHRLRKPPCNLAQIPRCILILYTRSPCVHLEITTHPSCLSMSFAQDMPCGLASYTNAPTTRRRDPLKESFVTTRSIYRSHRERYPFSLLHTSLLVPISKKLARLHLELPAGESQSSFRNVLSMSICRSLTRL